MSPRPWFAAAALLLPGVFLWLPWAAGDRTQAGYDRLLAGVEDSGLAILQNRFRRGWTESQAHTVVALPGYSEPGTAWRLSATTRIAHPVFSLSAPIQSRTRLTLRAPDGATWEFPVRLLGRLGADRKTVRLQPVDQVVKSDDSPGLVIFGAHGELRWDSRHRRVQGELEVGRLSLTAAKKERLALRGLRLGVDVRPDASAGRGRADLAIDSLVFTSRTSPLRLHSQGLALELTGASHARLLDADLGGRFSRLEVGAMRLEQGQLEVRLERLSVPAFARLARTLADVDVARRGLRPDPYAISSVLRHLPRLMAAAPELAVDRLHAASSHGPLEGAATIRLKPLQPGGLFDPKAWLEALEADYQVSLPEALASAHLREQVDELMRRGLLLRQHDLLLGEGALRRGVLSVNQDSDPLLPVGAAAN